MDFNFLEYGHLGRSPDLALLSSEVLETLSKFRSNPRVGDDFPCLFYLKDDGKIVCHFVSFPDRVSLGNSSFEWAWSGDLFTDPTYRGKGLASRLVREQVKLLHDRNIGWGGVFSTPAAVRLYEKQGFSIGYANRLLFVRDPSPFLAAHLHSKLLRSAGHSIYRVGFAIADRLLGLSSSGGSVEVRPCEVSSQEFVQVLKRLIYPGPGHFDDSPDMLRWRFGSRACDQMFVVSDRAAKKDLGYLALRSREVKRPLAGKYKDFRLMTAMDFGLFEDTASACNGLVSALMRLFVESEDAVLEVITSNPILIARARRFGMIRVGKGMSFAYSVPVDWEWPSLHVADWHLTHYRGDGFAFE